MARKQQHTVKLGLVGVSGFGWNLAQEIMRQDPSVDCRLVAAADLNFKQVPDRVETLTKLGVTLYDDAFEMFAAWQGKADAMYIASGISSHEPMTVAAAARGYHIHVEKPPAGTVQEVDRMIEAVQRNDRLAMVGFQAVHTPDMRFIKERVVDGRLGKVKRIVSYTLWPRAADYYTRNNWAGKVKVGNNWVLDGPATNACIHQINNMLFLSSGEAGAFTNPASIEAELYRAGPIDSYDTCALRIRTAEGPELLFVCTHCCSGYVDPKLEIQAERGTVSWQMFKGAKISYADGTTEDMSTVGQKIEKKGLNTEVSDFINAVRTGDKSLLGTDLLNGRRSILVVNGAFDAAGTIEQIPSKYIQRVDEGTEKARTVIEGVDQAILDSAKQFCLFSELSGVPWAKPAGRFDLKGYNHFPQRYGLAKE